ncbi:miles to go isoform X2 [Arctopsyche grandis]|uniref:miles to go isoform X2 n=1 Tax=Arctopsyche grandis TaxID=121162 RepID=UPI00406D7BB4
MMCGACVACASLAMCRQCRVGFRHGQMSERKRNVASDPRTPAQPQPPLNLAAIPLSVLLHEIGPANGGNGQQQFYGPPGYPPHFHQHGPPMPPPPPHPPHHAMHSPPQSYHKDERAHRQYVKLKKKMEQRHRNDGLGSNSGHSTPAPSPRKEFSNGVQTRGPGSTVGGTSSEGEGSSSAATSVQGDEEDSQPLLDFLSSLQTPQVSDVTFCSALVQWNAPILPEGVTLPSYSGNITYELLLGEKGRYKAIYSGSALSCRVQDLRPGTEYTVCLQAHAEEYTGAASETAIVRTEACEPSAPTALRATGRARTTLQLRWNAPNDNGSHILHYILQYDEGKGGDFVDLCKPRNKQHNLQKLEVATCYRFRLAAVNGVGRGSWSEEVAFSTCGTPPSPPSPPSLVHATSSSLALCWVNRPGDDDFSLQMEDEHNRHGFLVVYAGRETENICKGLVRCSNYKFRLLANNETGPSRWSDEVTFRTLPEKPRAPYKPFVKGKIHSNSFRVRWDPPGDTGGAEIQSYTLEINSGDGFHRVYDGAEQETTCDRLQPGCTYQVRSLCTTVGGISDWSDIQTITTEPVVPGPCLPPALLSDPRPYSIAITWQKPDYDGGSPVLEYNVEICEEENSRLVYKGKETECTVQELLPGRRYFFKVKAFNRVGGGQWSETLDVTSGAAPPETPNLPRAVAKSPYNVFVQWDEPVCNGGPIIDYLLEMASINKDDAFSPVFQGLQLSYDIKNLIPFSSYFFKVCAINKSGHSKWSEISEISTPGAPPGCPPLLTAEATATDALLSWQEPPCNGYPIQHYRIDIGEKTIVTNEPIMEYLLENLIPETIYKVRIQAVNEIGIGNYSPTLKVETLPPPPPPPLITCIQQGHNFLKLKWGEGKNTDFTQYIVEMQNPRRKEYQQVYQGTSFSFRVKKLQDSSKYKFRICASNDSGGQGDFSEDLEFETTPAPPATLKVPKLLELSETSFVVEWVPSKLSTDEQLTYIVQCCRTKDQDYKQVYKGSEMSTKMESLESGLEYSVRVCAERKVDGTFLHGAWSPALVVSIPAQQVLQNVTASPAPKRTPKRTVATFPMSERNYILLFLFGFVIVAFLSAHAVQQFIDWRKSV